MIGKFGRIAIAMAGMATAMLPLAAEAQARPGWGGGRHWRGDRGVDGGDVLAGLLIIGGIAAIASAASNANQRNVPRERDYRDQDYRDQDYRDQNYRGQDNQYRNEPTQNGAYAGGGFGQNGGQSYAAPRAANTISDAVDRCVDEASRNGEINEVFDATRTDRGYRVSGSFQNNDSFSCEVSSQGGVLLDLRRGQR